MTSPGTVPVSLAEIARIAGVGRAAVSNWRRRHDTFPARIGGTDVKPQFALTEVEQWLRDNDKLNEAGGLELLWPRFETLAGRDEAGLAIAYAGHRMRGKRSRAPSRPLSAEARALVAETVELGRREGTTHTFEFLLQRWLDAHVRQISATPARLATLMARIALRTRTAWGQKTSTVFDPACGSGHLLSAAAGQASGGVELYGCEIDSALAELAEARLAFAGDERDVRTRITAVDSLRDDPYPDLRADIALCNPPFNERDWGYEELATDPRWVHGLPPRTEPELAWVQHLLARLRSGGTAVVVLPPAVASRRAGRRIRGSLLRHGVLRAVVALPPGCAQPHSVSLQLWVLRAGDERTGGSGDDALLVDASAHTGPGGRGPDWEAIESLALTSLDGLDGASELPHGAVRVPLLDLLDDEVDVTPGRYVAARPEVRGKESADRWSELGDALASLRELSRSFACLDTARSPAGGRQSSTTVGDLVKAGALSLRPGTQPSESAEVFRDPRERSIPLLTVPDLLLDGVPSAWLAGGEHQTIAEEGDVVVAGVVRAFDAWVHEGPPVALGSQLFALRVDPHKLDAHFLAGCLRAPANGRHAGTHASASSRVDVRRLAVLQLPLEEQTPYSETFRRITSFQRLLARSGSLGTSLSRDLNDRLASGGLTTAG
ncbi:N-6 DNA Methylase [Streptomyces sp. BpilaLS-43]|uniref:N-6 DNA methylase n=1 Tax=Streptomyces sp. BpilaLS-43 TaxID=1839778 RepID=UPI00081B1DDE|nr:N-6 DNA methylase [Streptomyces sp. BpilaLS-43]SCD67305.1 N-6 DNA Methylase [Streptomyces sp. BpilaLS-43]